MNARSPRFRLVCVLIIGLAAGSSRCTAGAEKAPDRPKPWPGADTPLSTAVEYAALIVRAKAVDEASIQQRRTVHYSTAMDLGGGEMLRGGGPIDYLECRQTLRVVGVLAGLRRPEKLTLNYSVVDRSERFPGRRQEEQPIPKGAEVILVLHPSGMLNKALPDTAENRKAVDEATAAAEKHSLDRLIAATKYDRRTAEDSARPFTPKHDPKEIEAVFVAHKAEILTRIVPYLRSFTGARYPELECRVWGLPMDAEAGAPGQIAFRIDVWGQDQPKPQSPEHRSRPRRDRWSAALVWDRQGGRVAKLLFVTFSLKAVREAELVKARRIAASANKLHEDRPVMRYLWLPAWYVENVIRLPKQMRTENIPEEYEAIREKSGHNLVMLSYEFPEKAKSMHEVPYHRVFVDVKSARVVGVHETTIDMGPRYKHP